jgi:hypothetical protein
MYLWEFILDFCVGLRHNRNPKTRLSVSSETKLRRTNCNSISLFSLGFDDSISCFFLPYYCKSCLVYPGVILWMLCPKLRNNSLPLCIFETNEDFWLISGGIMYQGTKVCRAKELCRCDHWPWPCDLETEIPFCSVSPKRMKIFGWYLVWGCISEQRYVARKNGVDATFDLDSVTLKP